MATCPKCGTNYPPNVRICTRDGNVLSEEPAQPDAQVGKLLDGKYRLDAFLSHGGMGSVYRATHIMLDKTVAVKLIKPGLVTSPDIVRRFQREARAASNLHHPNIVGVFDLGQAEDGTLYIAMELINGPSLKDVIRSTGPMPSARIVRILRQVASALALAHRHNIIHRDLKPHNIMLATDAERQEVAKLLDFGIAKTFDEASTQLTMTGFALGTPQYMAPEQAAGKDVDGRTDLYSLGIILYEMLTGEVPFSDPSTPAILVMQMTEPPEPPSRRKPGVALSPALEAIALRCLEKDPAKRFENAELFTDALNRVDIGAGSAGAADAPTLLTPAASSAPTQATTVPSMATRLATNVPSAAPPFNPAAVAATRLAIPPVIAEPPGSATSTTQPTIVPAGAPSSPAAGTRSGGGNAALWLTLAAVAVLLIGVGMATQFGYMPWSGGSKTEEASATPSPDTAAPQASPAMADPGSGTKPAAIDGAALIGSADAPPAPRDTTGAQSGSGTRVSPNPAELDRSGQRSTPQETGGTIADGSNATAGRSGAITGRSGATGGRSGATGGRSGATAPPPEPPRPALPENPSVLFRCSGAPEICGAVRASVDQALERNNLPSVRNADRAAIIVTASASVLQERVNRDFGTALATRTYSVDLSGETREGDVVSMPAARTFSFDATFGRDRLDENARVIADDVVEKIRAFWKKRLQ